MFTFAYINPYYDQNLFGFFYQMFSRILLFVQGKLGVADLASDELQILVLGAVAVSSAIVGSFLVLRRMTMLANALSHTILIGIVIAYVLTHGVGGQAMEHYHRPLDLKSVLFASLMMGLITTFLTEFLTKVLKLQEDASIGIVFTSLFALGIIMVTALTRNAHVGIEVVMGNVDILHIDDLKLIAIVLAMNIILTILFYKEYQLTTFDPGFARALGISSLSFNYLLMLQASATVIGAFRVIGVLMVLAFLVGPALTARLLTDRLKAMIFFAAAIGAAASVLGVAISRHLLSVAGLALSTGGIVVCILGIVYAAVAILKLKPGLRW